MKKTLIICLFFFIISSEIQSKNIVIGQERTINSEVLNEERNISIYLPQDYSISKLKYPVIYILDGERYFHSITGYIDYFSSLQNLPEFIVVAIKNKGKSRSKDFNLSEIKNKKSGADTFINFLSTELIPFINTNYRTKKFKALAGHSLAGLFTIYVLIENPELFNLYLAASPALHKNNNSILNIGKNFFNSNLNGNISLFFSYGKNEWQPLKDSIEKFKIQLQNKIDKKLNWNFKYFKNDEHGTTGYRTFCAGLDLFYENFLFPFENPKKGTLEGVLEHYNNFSKKLGYNITIPVVTLQFVAFDLIMTKKNKEAFEILKYTIKKYPEDANTYNLLGIYHERKDQLEESKKAFLKACNIGEYNKDARIIFFKRNLERIEKKIKNTNS